MQQIADDVPEVIAKIKSIHLNSDSQESHHLFHWFIAFLKRKMYLTFKFIGMLCQIILVSICSVASNPNFCYF